MANTLRYGFKAVQKGFGEDAIPHRYPVAASQSIVAGDVVTLDSAGRVIIAVANSTTYLLGVAQTPSKDKDGNYLAVDSDIWVYDNPRQVFEAACTTGALADVYTTRSAAACFDLTGTTGAMYVNAAASSQDLFKCVGASKDPITGVDSVAGSNAMKLWTINPAAHVYGTIA